MEGYSTIVLNFQAFKVPRQVELAVLLVLLGLASRTTAD